MPDTEPADPIASNVPDARNATLAELAEGRTAEAALGRVLNDEGNGHVVVFSFNASI